MASMEGASTAAEQGSSSSVMLELTLPKRKLSVLCLGAHSDDIEIGCAGAVLTLLRRQKIDVTWIVFSASTVRRREAHTSARRLLRGAVSVNIQTQDFRDGFFPDQWGEIKEFFEGLKRQVSPDLVFTHQADDAHQDHRVICDLTWNTFRRHLILEYEIPKYDCDIGCPNLYFPLDKRTCDRKVRHVLSAFPSQRKKSWLTEDTFRALMRLRGVHCAAAQGYAEAFYARKVCVA